MFGEKNKSKYRELKSSGVKTEIREDRTITGNMEEAIKERGNTGSKVGCGKGEVKKSDISRRLSGSDNSKKTEDKHPDHINKEVYNIIEEY